MGIDNYLCAKEDVENAAVPTRDREQFSFTNGMMKILERAQSTDMRGFTAKLQNLEAQKKDLVVSITDHEDTLTVLEEECTSKEKEAQEALEIKSQALAAKLDIKANHERVMRSNGLTLAKDAPVAEPKPVKEPKAPGSVKNWLRSFAVFVGIETLAFVASYVILRENLDDMEVYTRLIANGTVFFIIDYLLRKKEHTGRSAFLIVFMAIYACMLLVPLLAEYLSTATTPAGDGWGFDEAVETVAVEAPTFGNFLLQNATLILVVVAILCLVTYLGFFNKKKTTAAPKAKKQVEKPKVPVNPQAEVMYTSLHGLDRDVRTLEAEVEALKAVNKSLPNQLLNDFGLLRDTLVKLDQQWQNLGMEQERIKQELSMALDKVMNELKEYQDHYQNMLQGTTNSFVFKPQWPTEQDLRAYYKIENVA